MAMSRLHMRKIREVLRLRFELGLSHREIAASTNMGQSTVGDCLLRYKATELSWPLPAELSDSELEVLFYPPFSHKNLTKADPDWLYVHGELKKKSVTKMLLWIEYKAAYPHGYQYTQFCGLYQEWLKSAALVFRNTHRAGEKAFIDYAGQTMPVWDATTGECRQAQIFIGVLGASNYTFAEATWGQTIPDWIGSHIRMFKAFGGIPDILVPDNLRSGVNKACRYDPVLNAAYYECARHYGTAIIPTRVRKPKDKAKVEAGVLLVSRWILAALRNGKFFSLAALNSAIAELLVKLNSKKFQKLEGTRFSLFESIDKPALKALPSTDYEICEYKLARVNINYHVELEGFHYSVPYQYVQKEVFLRYTPTTVKVFHKGEQIASHLRGIRSGGYATLEDHMPPRHKAHVEWTPERMINWVGEAGPSTKKVAETIIASRQHPEQSYKVILGMIRLGKKYSQERLENACTRALVLNTPYYSSIKNILSANLDMATVVTKKTEETAAISHDNIRGPAYYN